MRLAITGGTGLVGRFLVQEALAAGDEVTVLSRRPPAPGFYARPVAHLPHDLDAPPPALSGHDALIHAGFAHLPGRYRGGEGDDPAGFMRRNLEGSAALIAAAEAAGLARLVFLSSRAVYGRQPSGAVLSETTEPHPDSLYGQVKLEAEARFAASRIPATILRATGVYGPPGPGQSHKWAALFAQFAAGEPIAPRVGTELHGADLAAAMRLGLQGRAEGVLNASDLLLDRRDLLALWAQLSGQDGILPAAADGAAFNPMDCARLRACGWVPSGQAGLRAALMQMAEGTAPG